MPNRVFRVLQIDDDLALARLVEKALTRRGYAYQHARDVRSGLERIAQGGIVLDDEYVELFDHPGYLDGCRIMAGPPRQRRLAAGAG